MRKVLAFALAAILALGIVPAMALETVNPDTIAAEVKIEPNALQAQGSSVTPIDQLKDTTLTTAISSIPLNTSKYNPVANPQMVANVNSATTDDQLKMYKQMGINAVELSIKDDELTYDALYPIVERLRNFENGGFEILLASNGKFQKDTVIHLQAEGFDAEIERFKDYLKLMDSVNIRTVAIAWQPNGISRSGDTPVMIHGASAGATNMEGIDPYEIKNDRIYTREEMWTTFKAIPHNKK